MLVSLMSQDVQDYHWGLILSEHEDVGGYSNPHSDGTPLQTKRVKDGLHY